MNNLLIHPARPVRAIMLQRLPGEGDLWQAYYAGDPWTTAWRTVPGKRWLVRDALFSGNQRRGLPIVDDNGPTVPAPEYGGRAA